MRFKPPKAYFSGAKTIDAVEIFGFSKSGAGEFIQFARDIDKLKADAINEISRREEQFRQTVQRAEQAATEVSEAKKELSALKSQASRQRSTIRRQESEKNDLTAKSEVLKDTIVDNERTLSNLRSDISKNDDQKSNLGREIVTLETKLSDLRSNIDLFPTELDSFVKQGSKNTRTLFWLALAPIAVICTMFVILISGAVELSTKISTDQDINLSALVVSRAPYVIVSLAIITACYQIARFFITELIQINRQRLNLTKVSIIAKDVSAAAETGAELSEIERYGLRVRLKMEMLKSHLKGYIGPDFSVQFPKKITHYLPFTGFVKSLAEENVSNSEVTVVESKNRGESGAETGTEGAGVDGGEAREINSEHGDRDRS